MTTGNGWTKDKQLVEFRLKRTDEKFDKIFEMLWDMKAELASLKVKAGMWGVIGGSIPVLITVLIWVVKSL